MGDPKKRGQIRERGERSWAGDTQDEDSNEREGARRGRGDGRSGNVAGRGWGAERRLEGRSQDRRLDLQGDTSRKSGCGTERTRIMSV